MKTFVKQDGEWVETRRVGGLVDWLCWIGTVAAVLGTIGIVMWGR